MIAAHADAADTTCWRPSTPTSCATSQRFPRRWPATRTPATLYAMVRETQFFPTHEANVRAVRVSSYEQLCGCGYCALYVTGCVDGFMPARDAFEVVSTDADRDRVREADRRTFAAGVAKATDALMFSTFSRAPLELAERTKMQVARVRMEDGERIATLRPTCFLEEAGAAAPITLGGQALLADAGID